MTTPVRNTKGLRIYLTNTTSGNVLTPTAITATAPATVTVADTASLNEGDLVTIAGTDFPSLDGEVFIVSNITGTDFDLLGSDASGDTDATLGVTPVATAYADGQQSTLIDASTITINNETPDQISVGTFVSPNQSVPGIVSGAGTIDLGGFVGSPPDDGYKLLQTAEADGNDRILKVAFPGAAGYVVATGVISDHAIGDVPIDGAIGYTAQMTLNDKPDHRF